MEMTEAQHEAILAREIVAYNRRFDALGPLGQYQHMRRGALRTIAESRARLQDPDWRYRCLDAISRDMIARARPRLLKLRVWRVTGTAPAVRLPSSG